MELENEDLNDYGIQNESIAPPQEETATQEINFNKGEAGPRPRKEPPKQAAKDEWDDDDDLNTGL